MVMLNPAVVVVNLTAMDLNAIAAISVMSFISPHTAIVAMCSSDDAMQLSVSGDMGVTCFVRPSIQSSRLRQMICSLAGWGPSELDAETSNSDPWSMDSVGAQRDDDYTLAWRYGPSEG
jgi:DNA-binding NarL/FixJ family response regulator